MLLTLGLELADPQLLELDCQNGLSIFWLNELSEEPEEPEGTPQVLPADILEPEDPLAELERKGNVNKSKIE